jgi:hypothetical protein
LISADVPDTCQITFAQILARHGARDPTSGKTEKYHDLIHHIHENVKHFKGKYSFLKKYKYILGADKLTLFGEKQMINSGIKFYDRYQSLAKDNVPFIRTSGQDRVIESALNWTQGFHLARGQDKTSGSDEYPYNMVIIPEGTAWNNTLSHHRCVEFETGETSNIGNDAQKIYLDKFVPSIKKRLNKHLQGADLDDDQVISMMDMCPFNTVASKFGTPSPFCNLFREEEWHQYDYYQSLGKYYGYSWGNPLGPTQGVGFTNELIARLVNSPVQDHTNTNSTLDSSPETFPITKNIKLYADFSHDNDITPILAALGLYNSTEPLSKTHLQTEVKTNGYSASWTVPFSSRAYFEKMKCEGVDEEFVRVLVNDRVIPLEFCGGDLLGRCALGKFVEGLSFARSGGHWDKCFT